MDARRAFLIRINPADRRAVLEDVRTGARVAIDDLAQIGDHLERWLGDASAPNPRQEWDPKDATERP